jgi:DNA-binding transcriptional ArsR family regulator
LNIDPERLDEAMRALSHRERRQILAACRDKACSAGELAGQSRLAMATVSEHLKVLRKTGLADVTKDGRSRLYRTNAEMLAAVLAALAKSLEHDHGA